MRTDIIPEPGKKGIPFDYKRANEILRKVVYENRTLTDVSKDYGVTRERIRQICNKLDPVLYNLHKDINRIRSKINHEANSGPGDIYFCSVCGVEIEWETKVGGGRRNYCSERHFNLYKDHLRYHVNEEIREIGRKATAKWNILNNNNRHIVRYSERLLNGESEYTGRWLVRGSKTHNVCILAYKRDWPIFKELPEEIQNQIIEDVTNLKGG